MFGNNNNSGFVFPVQPAGYGSYGGMGGLGGDWLVLAFLLFPMMMMFGGWGGMGGMGGNNLLYPFMNQADITTSGFQNQANTIALNGIQANLGDIQTQLCGGFAGVTGAVTNAQAALSQQLSGIQVAEMQQDFAMQQAINQGFNGTQAQLAQCCCENRLATCQTQNIVQTEGAATRAAMQAVGQNILDKMCQQEIDALKAQNQMLQTANLMKDLAASQSQQTRELVADNTMQTQYIVNRVAPYPIPAYTVANPATPTAAAAGA